MFPSQNGPSHECWLLEKSSSKLNKMTQNQLKRKGDISWHLAVNNEVVNLVTLLHLKIACFYSFMTAITHIWQTLDLVQFHSDTSQSNGKTCSGHRPDLRFGSRRPMRMISQSLVPTSCLQQQQKTWTSWGEQSDLTCCRRFHFCRLGLVLIWYCSLNWAEKAEFVKEGKVLWSPNMWVMGGSVTPETLPLICLHFDIDFLDFRHLFVFEGVPETVLAWWEWVVGVKLH